ncbi:MAG TPA: replication-associated recombination protein A [Methylomirabilota bacterium]|nr:replication-associated recombination protein A [Methylomirabilota bacterium]
MNLAYRLRPQTLKEFFGQGHLVGKNKILQKMIETQTISSMIFWGPPGSGKTTLAYLLAKASNATFHHLSAVETGKADLQKIIKLAEEDQKKKNKTILFIDEIHRWNKAQQDALLPYVESGLITLIGATTENPSFEVISALLSRCRIFVLKSLEKEDLEKIIDRALTDQERGVGKYKKSITDDAKDLLMRLSGGDARIMLNALEIMATTYKEKKITPETVKEIFQTRSAGLYDKKADEHYNIISAFIKSMRGSDVDASLYYLVRMLENGEDPKFIARRMIIFASEDIGIADRGALIQANEAFEAVNKIGMPESQLILAHVTIYLASAKKSRAVPNALGLAKQAVYEFPNEQIPLHLRNAPTKLMKNLGYGKNYEWSDKHVGPKEKLSFLPEKLKDKKFFEP